MPTTTLTAGNDVHNDELVVAGPENTTIFGLEGDDSIFGTQGDDLIYGGEGNDTISPDFAVLTPAVGGDTVFGGGGDDVINRLTDAADSVTGSDGADTIEGQGGNDTIDGGPGADSILAGAGDDIVRGGAGGDTMSKSSWSRLLRLGSSWCHGGLGVDTLDYSGSAAPVTVNLAAQTRPAAMPPATFSSGSRASSARLATTR